MKECIRIDLTAVVSCTGMVIGNVAVVVARFIPVKMIMMVLSKVWQCKQEIAFPLKSSPAVRRFCDHRIREGQPGANKAPAALLYPKNYPNLFTLPNSPETPPAACHSPPVS